MKARCDELRLGIYRSLKELREGRGWGLHITVLTRKIINGDLPKACPWLFMSRSPINCVMNAHMDNLLSIHTILFCVFIFNKEILISINMLKYH